MDIKINKWGNSPGIRIPMPFIKSLHLKCGDYINISIENDKIILEPKKYKLENLLIGLTPEDMQPEAFPDAGLVGEEVW